MSPIIRRVVVAVAVPALAVSVLAGSAPSYADSTPSGSAGATWLESQLTNGLVFNPDFGGYNDYGLSIDFGLGLAEVGGRDSTVAAISDALAAEVGNYVGDGTTESYSGALGKAAVFARVAGDDPSSYGGVDLLDRLTDRVITTGPSAGRIQDASEFGDFANSIGQSFAVRALDDASSPISASATDFLLKQQCAEGFFRLGFAADKSAADQTCDGDPSAAGETDVTALVMINLSTHSADPEVASAMTKGAEWLASIAKADGSFGGGPLTEGANANSTGLAAWALGRTCNVAAAEKAADWVRGLQVDAGDGAPLADDVGAIAYDSAALETARAAGITDATRDQFRRATAQAMGALVWDEQAAATVRFGRSPRFVKAGSRPRLTITGVSAGETVCFTSPSRAKAIVGDGQPIDVIVINKGKTATIEYGATTGPGRARQQITFLAPKKVRFELKAQARKGRKQAVRVGSLEPGEKVRVYFRGVKVETGRVRPNGKYVGRFKVTGPTGRARVKVIGQFTTRKGVSSFKVVR